MESLGADSGSISILSQLCESSGFVPCSFSPDLGVL